jgi:voltage-gated potassium channel
MPLRTRIYLLLAALTALIVGGTVGYRLLEGWSWFDGLYMTVITLATIGYGEVHTLSTPGRGFTLVLIVFGVAVFGFIISTLTQSLIESEFANRYGRRKVFKSIDQLKQHYILCGAGKVGMRIIEEMKRKQVEFVIIERDHDVAEKLLTQGHLVLIGDATDETVMQGARVEHARALITAASNDPENVYISLTARGMNPNLYIVARATDLYAEKQLVRAGANRVISPTIIASHRMAQAALSPAVADFIELTTMTESLDLSFEQVLIAAGSRLEGVRLKDSGIRSELNAIIVSITPQEGEMVFNPDGEYQLKAGDLLIAIGTHAGMIQLAKIAGA